MEKRYIGIDLHRNRFTCCIRLENERTYVTEWALEDLARFAKKLRSSDQVAVEITANTRLFYDAVAPQVQRVAVVDTNQFGVISRSVKKTDPNDARLLSLYLSKGLLPEVRMKDKERAQLASLTQTRDTLVKQRSALKNKINNLLSARGLNLAKEALSSEKKLAEVSALPFDEVVRIELRVLVEQIRSLNQSITELEKTIGEEGSKLEGHQSLASIKGIGPLTSAILLSVIGDIQDFPDEGRLASYFGIVPRVSNSNETERSGRIHKRGTKLGRTALVQSALIAARYSPYLKRFYEQVKARRGAGKAIIALARKFLGIIYRTLKNKWVFADFPNFVLAEEP
ncbi:MAG: IS110 family transposase [Acidobacteriaceae bacterium]|nr:IS110 family transposase [Acidobacteriaceae bacterium]MBV9036617.1 IS110 family transposase [Acidobacteriaceae bacterium]MBV9676455.1 IS110 family transposase [Acidobacteriaceae bacterium]